MHATGNAKCTEKAAIEPSKADFVEPPPMNRSPVPEKVSGIDLFLIKERHGPCHRPIFATG
jgi:hypothetical protein